MQGIAFFILFTTFAIPKQKCFGGLSDGVMVTLQILVLPFKVRILVGQRKSKKTLMRSTSGSLVFMVK